MRSENVYIITGPNGAGKTTFAKAEVAMKKAVKEVIAQHKKDGHPLAVWENGKVKKVML